MLPYVQRDFAGVIQLRTLKRGEYPGLSRWALNVTTGVLRRQRFDSRRGESNTRTETEIGAMCFEDGGRSHSQNMQQLK